MIINHRQHVSATQGRGEPDDNQSQTARLRDAGRGEPDDNQSQTARLRDAGARGASQGAITFLLPVTLKN
jgi:hypothetical protein